MSWNQGEYVSPKPWESQWSLASKTHEELAELVKWGDRTLPTLWNDLLETVGQVPEAFFWTRDSGHSPGYDLTDCIFRFL